MAASLLCSGVDHRHVRTRLDRDKDDAVKGRIAPSKRIILSGEIEHDRPYIKVRCSWTTRFPMTMSDNDRLPRRGDNQLMMRRRGRPNRPSSARPRERRKQGAAFGRCLAPPGEP
jgi:hypothetical protein